MMHSRPGPLQSLLPALGQPVSLWRGTPRALPEPQRGLGRAGKPPECLRFAQKVQGCMKFLYPAALSTDSSAQQRQEPPASNRGGCSASPELALDGLMPRAARHKERNDLHAAEIQDG